MTLDQLLAALKRADFVIVNENAKAFELRRSDLRSLLYVKGGVSAAGASKSRLVVIHPDYIDCVGEIRAAPGLALGATPKQPIDKLYFHSSSMRSFPKRKKADKEPINYGIDVNVDSDDSLERLIDVLLNRESRSPADDIAGAAAQLSRLPVTERTAIISARLGQGVFRNSLIEYWSACSVTAVKDSRLLRASHIKPWRDADHHGRLDPYNGLLLTPNLDHCFDRGWVSFTDEGKILINEHRMKASDLLDLGIHPAMQLRRVEFAHRPYLAEHRRLHQFEK